MSQPMTMLALEFAERAENEPEQLLLFPRTEEDRSFTLEEATQEWKSFRRVTSKRSFRDVRGMVWPTGTTGCVVNKRKHGQGYALVVQISRSEGAPTSVLVKSVGEYHRTFRLHSSFSSFSSV